MIQKLGVLLILSQLAACSDGGFRCPSGMEQVGDEPPKGTFQLCGKSEYGVFFKNGPAKYYYPSGELKQTGYWKDNQKDGEWTCFDKKGVVLAKQQWELTEIKRVKSNAEIKEEERKSGSFSKKEEPKKVYKGVMKKGDPCPWDK